MDAETSGELRLAAKRVRDDSLSEAERSAQTDTTEGWARRYMAKQETNRKRMAEKYAGRRDKP